MVSKYNFTICCFATDTADLKTVMKIAFQLYAMKTDTVSESCVSATLDNTQSKRLTQTFKMHTINL